MAVANPRLQEDWGRWGRKPGAKRRIPWRERMMRWVKVEVMEGEEDGEDTESFGNEESEEEEVNGTEKLGEGEEEEEVAGEADTRSLEEEEKERDGEKRDGNERPVEEEEREVEAEGSYQSDEDEEEEGREEGGVEDERSAEEEWSAEEEGEDEDPSFHQGQLGNVAERHDEDEEDAEEDEEHAKDDEEDVKEDEEHANDDEEHVKEDEEDAKDDEEDAEEDEEHANDDEEDAEDEDPCFRQGHLSNVAERHDEDEEDAENDEEDAENDEEDAENEEEEAEEDHVSDSAESDGEDADSAESETEDVNSERLDIEEDGEGPAGRSARDDSSVFDDWTSQEMEEKEGGGREESSCGDTTLSDFWTMEEMFRDEDLQAEDEEGQHSVDEGEDSGDEDELKLYSDHDYPRNVFLTLKQFKDSSLFTDLVLTTEDGKSVEVHFLVLAAVSSLVWRNRADRRDSGVGVQRRSVSLGPGVDRVGLEAIVEFAYTGLISCLNLDNVSRIKAAAEQLGAPRVLEFCAGFLQVCGKPDGKEKKDQMSSGHQMMSSLQAVKQLWLDAADGDVVLEAVGGSFHAHRAILAASSDYFRSMFTLGMKECRQQRVSLPLVPALDLQALLACSYSGLLQLGWDYIFELTSTALQLQYQPALSLCLTFLQKEMTPHTCLDVVAFAEAYEVPPVLEAANDFILRQFQKVAATAKFRDLPGRKLFKYLNSRSLCVSSELVVFKAIVSWIQERPKTRAGLTKVLMKAVHFPLMTFKEFKEVRSNSVWSSNRLKPLYEEILEDFCSDETSTQSQCRVYLPKESLVLTGGEQISEDLERRSISKDVWFGNSLRNLTGIRKAMEWRRLGEMPEPARFSHEVAVLKGQLYVFGGKKYYGDADVLNSVYRFDPLQNSWESLAEMLEKRSSFSVLVLDGKIFAMGGQSDSGFRDSVERYCPAANSWSFTWPLDLLLGGHVAKVLHGKIFVSGGRNDDYPCVASMFQYHPETGSTYLSNMAAPRAHHCMEILGDRLYVAGGVGSEERGSMVDLLSCEVYSPDADSWTAFAALPVPHVGAGSAVLEGKFYVLGGYSQEDYSDTKMVHRYDAEKQSWENMGKMPGPNNDIRASVLCLPQHFRSLDA